MLLSACDQKHVFWQGTNCGSVNNQKKNCYEIIYSPMFQTALEKNAGGVRIILENKIEKKDTITSHSFVLHAAHAVCTNDYC